MPAICPKCNSEDVRYPPVKGEYGTYDTKVMYCRKCGHEFPSPYWNNKKRKKNKNHKKYPK